LRRRFRATLARGAPGETYAIGGNAEMSNLDVVHTICRILAELVPGRDYEDLITFVKGPSRTRSPLRDRRLEDSPRSRVGRRTRPSAPGCGAPCSGTSTTRLGSPR
jgi:hypothetical protein